MIATATAIRTARRKARSLQPRSLQLEPARLAKARSANITGADGATGTFTSRARPRPPPVRHQRVAPRTRPSDRSQFAVRQTRGPEGTAHRQPQGLNA